MRLDYVGKRKTQKHLVVTPLMNPLLTPSLIIVIPSRLIGEESAFGRQNSRFLAR